MGKSGGGDGDGWMAMAHYIHVYYVVWGGSVYRRTNARRVESSSSSVLDVDFVGFTKFCWDWFLGEE